MTGAGSSDKLQTFLAAVFVEYPMIQDRSYFGHLIMSGMGHLMQDARASGAAAEADVHG